MKSIKCKNCDLSNFPSDVECKRCGQALIQPRKKARSSPRSFSIWSILMIVGALAVVYYMYSGVNGQMEEIDAEDKRRISTQPVERPAQPGLSRTKYDQQRAGKYGDAVKNSQSIKTHEQRGKDTEKAIQQVSNGR